jgi:flotillin
MLDDDIQNKLIHNLAIPAAFLIAGYVVITMLYKYIIDLRVDGKANEWILILNNGKLKTAGVGLRTFRGPFDQVARFPSKVNMVNFSTEQVTKEMQGVTVRGMIVWSIRRTDDGPFNAYKNLGDDLSSGNPVTANDNLVSMASAIVRAAIANSSINEMLKNRESLRKTIRDDMDKVVKGWGVWLETIEITDVQISSNQLFKDLQSEFREARMRDAEVYTMIVDEELAQHANEVELALKKSVDAFNAEYEEYAAAVQMEINEEIAEHGKKLAEIEQEKVR